MPHHSLSIVIPLFNEEQTLPELWSRVSAMLDGLSIRGEVIFVNDGSSDGTLAALHALCARDSRAKLVSLSRNFGHGSALAAGIAHAFGDIVVLMDGDLQDVPEAVPDMVAKVQEGADVAYAIRASRQESMMQRVAFRGFYRMLQRMSSIKQPLDAGIFCAASKRVMDIVRSMPEHNRYFPGLRAFAGFEQVGIEVHRDARHAGDTRVGVKGLIRLAMDALFAYSYVPLRLLSYLGGVVLLSSIIYLGVVLYKRFFGFHITGWSSTLCVILALGGTQLIFLSVLGEYLSRIYDESKRRPVFVVGETRNLDAGEQKKPRPVHGRGLRPPRSPRRVR